MRPLIASIVLALLLASCASETNPGASTDGGAPAELRIAVGGEPEEGFDPALGWGDYGNPLFQSTLLTRDPDLELVNDLAEDWESSDDGLVYTVTLRDEVRFSDGEPLTANDVAYTYNTTASAGGEVDLSELDEAVAVDESTVEFRLERPWSTFPGRMARLGIVPEHAHGDDYGRNPIGSGPWIMERWDEGQQLIATRNDDYYGDQPDFERLVFQFTEQDATLAAARAGDLDLAFVPQTVADQEVEGMRLEAVPSVDNRGISFPFVPETGEVDENGVTIGNDVTSDLAVRRAINVAIDREALVDGIINGYGTPAYTSSDGLPWGNPDAEVADGDVDQARQILADGGWEEGGDGVVEKDGVRGEFSIVYRPTDPERQGMAIAVADQLAEIGLDVTPDGREGSDAFDQAPHQPVVWGRGLHDASEQFNLYHSSLADSDDSFNANRFADRYVDEQLELGMAATDQEEADGHFAAAVLGPDAEGYGPGAEEAYAWFVNIDHTYQVSDCLDLGELQIQPHGHGYPITSSLSQWQWTC